jgi:Putative restriction endonuclease
MRKIRVSQAIPCAIFLLTVVGWNTTSAQQEPWRMVQGNDSTLYLVTSDTRYVVNPDPISDDDLAMLSDGGSLGAQLPIPPAPQPLITPAPLPQPAATEATEHAELQTQIARFLLNFATAPHGLWPRLHQLARECWGCLALIGRCLLSQRPPTDEQHHPLRAPDLAVEIRSPSDQLTQERDKCRWWAAQGASVALLVDTDPRRVEWFDADGHWQTYSGSTILPLEQLLPPYGPKEFTLSADDIFAILNTP